MPSDGMKRLATFAMLGEMFGQSEYMQISNRSQKFQFASGLNSEQFLDLVMHMAGYGYDWGIMEEGEVPVGEEIYPYFSSQAEGEAVTEQIIKLAEGRAKYIEETYGVKTVTIKPDAFDGCEELMIVIHNEN